MKSFIYRYLLLTVVIFLMVPAGACTDQESAVTTRLQVYVAVPPIAWLVDQIGGDHVDANVLITAGKDPHVFEISPRQLTDLGTADLYLLGNLPFEQRIMERIESSGAKVKIADITPGIEQGADVIDDGDDHSHHSADPHIWLAPHNLKTLAENITEVLRTNDPQHGNDYRDNFLILLRSIDELQKEISAELAPYKGEAIYVQHPAFGTFLKEFGLRQESVEGTSSEVAARHLNELIDSAREEGVKAIFTQPQFSDRGAKTVANAIGAEIRHLDPLAFNVVENLRTMADAFRDDLASRMRQEN